jgi:hypothetical protein
LGSDGILRCRCQAMRRPFPRARLPLSAPPSFLIEVNPGSSGSCQCSRMPSRRQRRRRSRRKGLPRPTGRYRSRGAHAEFLRSATAPVESQPPSRREIASLRLWGVEGRHRQTGDETKPE